MPRPPDLGRAARPLAAHGGTMTLGRWAVLCVALLAAVSLVLETAHAEPGTPRRHAPDEILVKLRADLSATATTEALARVEPRQIRPFRAVERLYRLTLAPDVPLDQALSVLRRSPDVVYAEPNFVVQRSQAITPNDPYYSYQWALPLSGIDAAELGAHHRSAQVAAGWTRASMRSRGPAATLPQRGGMPALRGSRRQRYANDCPSKVRHRGPRSARHGSTCRPIGAVATMVTASPCDGLRSCGSSSTAGHGRRSRRHACGLRGARKARGVNKSRKTTADDGRFFHSP